MNTAKSYMNMFKNNVTPNNHGVPNSQSDKNYKEIKDKEATLKYLYDKYVKQGKNLNDTLVKEIMERMAEFKELIELKRKYLSKYAPGGVYGYGAKHLRKTRKNKKSRKNRKSRSN